LLPGAQLACRIDECKLPFAPETTAALTAAYTLPFGELGNFTLRADYKYSDKYYIDPDNTEAVAQDAYDSVDARAALAAFDKGWEIFLGGTNLTNEAVIANGVTSVPNNSQIVTYKPPRQWYAGVRVNF
jgi:outer membrane receptor protein involved in Fe transport